MLVRAATVLRERDLRRVLCAWQAAFRQTPIEHHQSEEPHDEPPARSEKQRSGGGAEEQRPRRSEGGHDGGHRIRTCTGLPPAVFKTAALPVRSSPPDCYH